MTITLHVWQLRNNIDRERVQCRGRSLIFVAHSLGGILVKDAIIRSHEKRHQQSKADIADSCRHILFFGTPHLGSDLALWGSIVNDIVGALPDSFSTYDKVLHGLSPDSEILDNISGRFNAFLD